MANQKAESKSVSKTKSQGSNTCLIVATVILGIFLIAGIVIGGACYWLYKIGNANDQKSKQAESTFVERTAGWKTYSNSRYGFSVKYPADFNLHQSENGDGGSWISTVHPGITLNAYGTPNSSSQTLDEYLNAERARVFERSREAEELHANEATLGGKTGQYRQWRYIASDNYDTMLTQTTVLNKSSFYTLQMIVWFSDYDQYEQTFNDMTESSEID